jgi:hypothetical protein
MICLPYLYTVSIHFFNYYTSIYIYIYPLSWAGSTVSTESVGFGTSETQKRREGSEGPTTKKKKIKHKREEKITHTITQQKKKRNNNKNNSSTHTYIYYNKIKHNNILPPRTYIQFLALSSIDYLYNLYIQFLALSSPLTIYTIYTSIHPYTVYVSSSFHAHTHPIPRSLPSIDYPSIHTIYTPNSSLSLLH